MSATSQGPGWWQASDGRWYPPESAPAPQSPYPGYSADVLPSGPPPGTPVPTAGKATTTLVLAIVSFVVCPVLPAIAALIVAAQAERQIRESGGRLGGEGIVKAGRIVAIVNIALSTLMIPVMLAIAIPTFLGAQERAQDRAAQSDLRSALIAEKVYATDNRAWAKEPSVLAAIEPSITFDTGAVPAREDAVYVTVLGPAIGLAAKSDSGTCFYLTTELEMADVAYATDPNCGPVQEQNFVGSW